MSKTSKSNSKVVDIDQPATRPHPMPPPKLRRRPGMILGAAATVAVGAIVTGWAWLATTDTQDVLVARHTIERGSLIEADDIKRIQLSADPALKALPGSSYGDVIGKKAGLDIAAGALLTEEATTSSPMPPDGMSVVGLALATSHSPAVDLRTGDRVRVVVTPAEGAEAPAGAPEFTEAEVVAARADETSGMFLVDVLVPYADAPVLASRAASGNVGIVLDSEAP